MITPSEHRDLLHRLLAQDSIDFLGITEKLLTNRTLRPEALEWLREMGFVHLYTASGIHLYLLADLMDSFSRRICQILGVPVHLGLRMSALLQFLIWCWLWMLSDFRPGLLRPLLLVGLRSWGRRSGWRWRRWMPLLLAVMSDLLTEVILHVFLDQPTQMGARIHYALAVGGGLLGYEYARDRKWGSFGQHVSLAWCSWIFTGILQLITNGTVSPWTPVISLLTLPLITGVFYPALIGTVALLMVFPDEFWLHETLRWLSVGLNHVFFQLSKVVDANGGWIEVSTLGSVTALASAAAISVWLSLRGMPNSSGQGDLRAGVVHRQR